MKEFMKQIKVYLIELLLVILFALCTLFNFTNNKYFTAILLVLISIGLSFLFKKKLVTQTNKKKVLIIMAIFGILYIAFFYMFGLYTGFYRSSMRFGISSLIENIIPISIILIMTEYIRSRLLIDQSMKSKILVIALTSIIDISIYKNLYSSHLLDSFLALVGFISFSAIANNFLYTYLCTKFDKEPIILYKLITVLYVYFVPVIPNVYTYFRAFTRMIYPLFIYFFVEYFYNTDRYRKKKY